MFSPTDFIFSFPCLWWILICCFNGDLIIFIFDIHFLLWFICGTKVTSCRIEISDVDCSWFRVFYFCYSVKSFSFLDNFLTFPGDCFLNIFLYRYWFLGKIFTGKNEVFVSIVWWVLSFILLYGFEPIFKLESKWVGNVRITFNKDKSYRQFKNGLVFPALRVSLVLADTAWWSNFTTSNELLAVQSFAMVFHFLLVMIQFNCALGPLDAVKFYLSDLRKLCACS